MRFLDSRPSRTTTTLCVAFLSLVWGTTWAAIRIGLEDIPPFTGVALRFALAGLLLVTIAHFMGVSFRAGALERRLWVVHALTTFCISYGTTYWVEQYIPSGLTSILFATFPLFVAAIAHFSLPGERISLVSAGGILLGFLGVVVLLSEDFSVFGEREAVFAASVMLLSPMSAAVGNVAIKKYGSTFNTLSLNGVAMVISAGLMGILAVLVESDRSVEFTGPAVGALLYLAIMGSVVTFTLYFWLLKHVSATRLALIAYLIPAVAVVIGILLFDEPLTLKIILGGLLVFAGVSSVVRSA